MLYLGKTQKYFSLCLLSLASCGILFFDLCVHAAPVLAQIEQPIPDPLEISLPDPLIPRIERNLTPFEIRRLREALDRLNQEAQKEFDAGNGDKAFAIWYRELRLRRKLGLLEELKALGRVGEIAWNNSRTQDVKIITKRLILLQQQAQSQAPLSPELLVAFAQAYQQVHNIDRSIYIYKLILSTARQNQNKPAEEQALKTLGQLYLNKFDYPNAAQIYEELLDRAQARGNSFEEGIYLQTLAEIYSQALQPENAVKIKEQLANNYLLNKKLELIPNLKIEIGADYESLKLPEKASQNYQEAFSLGWSLQQFSVAGTALKRLANLYQTYNQEDYALKIYQELLKVEQQSYNYYGLMNVYDKIGQIYLKRQQYPQALAAFQQALILAQTLKYQEDYFLKQIQEITPKIK